MNDLQSLIVWGKIEKEYEIYGKKFLLRTLTSGEIRDSFANSAYDDILARLQATKIEVLLYSIVSINGKYFYGKENSHFKDKEEAKKFLENLQPEVLHSIHEKYQELTEMKETKMQELKNGQGTSNYA